MTPELRWLSDPTVFAVNRLDAHSDHLCCRTLDEAESGLTSLRQSLDGAWRFAWSANPAARPADFWQPDADLSGFDGQRCELGRRGVRRTRGRRGGTRCHRPQQFGHATGGRLADVDEVGPFGQQRGARRSFAHHRFRQDRGE